MTRREFCDMTAAEREAWDPVDRCEPTAHNRTGYPQAPCGDCGSTEHRGCDGITDPDRKWKRSVAHRDFLEGL